MPTGGSDEPLCNSINMQLNYAIQNYTGTGANTDPLERKKYVQLSDFHRVQKKMLSKKAPPDSKHHKKVLLKAV